MLALCTDLGTRVAEHAGVRLALIFLVACTDLDFAAREHAIVGGAASPEDRAAVALVGAGGVYCSGVLIDPLHVLTAAHCLPPHVDDPIEELEVFFGVDITQGGTRIAIAEARAHPSWSPASFTDDIGILALAEPSPIEPALVASSIEIARGDALRAVGYGLSQDTDRPGIRRAGIVAVDAIEPETIRLAADGAVTCDGDSGGPLFAGEVVVGIHSRSNCQTAALAERVDVHETFVADFLAGRAPDLEDEIAGGCASSQGGSWMCLLIVAGVLAVYSDRWRAVQRVLSITQGGKTTRVELSDGQEVTLGRGECDVVLDDRMVSRRHAVLRGRGTLEVEDLGSHNGTLVVIASGGSGETLTAPTRCVRLQPNVPVEVGVDSVIQIGGASITVEIAGRSATVTGTVVADATMARLYELAKRVAPSDLSVLLLGETGAGKDVLARYIHKQSTRSRSDLLSLNCGAVPEHLLEAELFGYEKGAFTGAAKTTPGLLESADKSTVFLDEVGELSPAFQVKLLRVLETGTLMRVGGREPLTIDVRYIAATNRDLSVEIAAGRFREDLYYRLNGITLSIPPLRQRRDEILSLAEKFLAQERDDLELSAEACAMLEAYDWPGNVRQLRAVIRRAAVLCRGSIVTPEHVQLSEPPIAREPTPTERPTLPSISATPEGLRDMAEQLEKQRIVDALESVGGNQTRAAEVLGLTRRALVIRLEKYGITRPRKGR